MHDVPLKSISRSFKVLVNCGAITMTSCVRRTILKVNSSQTQALNGHISRCAASAGRLFCANAANICTASHILVKHEESRRCSSWKDVEG
jgi:hypothetical protein